MRYIYAMAQNNNTNTMDIKHQHGLREDFNRLCASHFHYFIRRMAIKWFDFTNVWFERKKRCRKIGLDYTFTFINRPLLYQFRTDNICLLVRLVSWTSFRGIDKIQMKTGQITHNIWKMHFGFRYLHLPRDWNQRVCSHKVHV